MSQFLDQLEQEELDAMFKRLGKLIERAIPDSRLGGKCGFFLLLVDQAQGEGKPPTCCQFTSTIPPETLPEILHEFAEVVEDINDHLDAEEDDG